MDPRSRFSTRDYDLSEAQAWKFWNKITFIPKLGGMCLHQNLGRRTRKLEASRIESSKNQMHKD